MLTMATYKTRAQFVADDLRRRILGGEFKGGTQLRQDALAKDYDVSRIPVREALLTLESEGLVEFYAHRGAFTTELSAAKIRELFDLRVLLEAYVLRHAITKLTDADLEKAEDILKKYDQALRWRTTAANITFHRARACRPARNPRHNQSAEYQVGSLYPHAASLYPGD